MCERAHWIDSRTDTIDGNIVTTVSFSDGARRVEKMERAASRRYHELSIRKLNDADEGEHEVVRLFTHG